MTDTYNVMMAMPILGFAGENDLELMRLAHGVLCNPERPDVQRINALRRLSLCVGMVEPEAGYTMADVASCIDEAVELEIDMVSL